MIPTTEKEALEQGYKPYVVGGEFEFQLFTDNGLPTGKFQKIFKNSEGESFALMSDRVLNQEELDATPIYDSCGIMQAITYGEYRLKHNL